MAKITNPTHEREAEARVLILYMREAIEEVNVSPQGQERDRVMRLGQEMFERAAEEGDIGRRGGVGANLAIIIAVERAFIQAELDQFADSPTMRTSLREGIKNLEIIETYLTHIKDPARYRLINDDHALEKNRRGNLPYDEARQSLRSHITRLRNLDTSRMDKPERTILEQRRKNMIIAEDVYIAKQKTALNIKE